MEHTRPSVRTALAALAFAGALLVAAPAYAACTVAPGATVLTPPSGVTTNPGDFVTVTGGDNVATLNTPIDGEGVIFDVSGGANIAVINNTRAESHIPGWGDDAVGIVGDFGTACYDGTAVAEIVGQTFGLFIAKTGATAGTIDFTVAHPLTGGRTGIYIENQTADTPITGTVTANIRGSTGPIDGYGIDIQQKANGNVSLNTSGDINAMSGAINVEHTGQTGDVRIETAAGTTLSTSGFWTDPGYLSALGPAGIAVVREYLGPQASPPAVSRSSTAPTSLPTPSSASDRSASTPTSVAAPTALSTSPRAATSTPQSASTRSPMAPRRSLSMAQVSSPPPLRAWRSAQAMLSLE